MFDKKYNWRFLWLSALAGFVISLLAVVIVFLYVGLWGQKVKSDNNLSGAVETKNGGVAIEKVIYGKNMSELASKVVALGRVDNEQVVQLAPSNILSSAMPLTSDGWAVALKPAGSLNKLGVVWNRLFYPAEKIISDPLTGLIFLKIKVQGLPLAPFGKMDNLTVGSELVAFDYLKTLYPTRLLNPHLVLSSASVHSSESLDVFGQTQPVPAGVPIFNGRGEFIGLAKNNGSLTSSDYIQQALKDILKDGKIHRPFLGVDYLDVSSVVYVAKNTNKPALGALIKSGKEPAVLKGSPAERAGLKEGDVILAVDNFEVNENQTLAEVIAGFSPGTKVVLSVLRGGQEKKIEVTLGSR